MDQHKFLIALLLVMITAASSGANASEESVRAAIQYQVSQRHPTVVPGFWEGLGSEALPVIKKMYFESTNGNEKSFLIDGLSHFNDASTGSFLEGEAAASQNEVLKRKLLTAVIQSEGERSFEFVEPFLKDDDGHIRLSVAQGLKAFDKNDKIQKRLAEFRAKEKSAWVLADLNKKSPFADLQRPRKIAENQPVKNAAVSKPAVEVAKTLPVLPEKNWAGIWRGSYVTESKVILVEANLVLLDAASVPMKWKVELKLPKGVKQDWKNGEFALNYFQTNRAHWIEVRNPKADIVFLAQRKVN